MREPVFDSRADAHCIIELAYRGKAPGTAPVDENFRRLVRALERELLGAQA